MPADGNAGFAATARRDDGRLRHNAACFRSPRRNVAARIAIMNDTATAGGASGASLIPSTTDAFTFAHLVVMAVFAALVIAAIVWGARLKRQRRTAERDIADHNAEVESIAPAAPPAEAPPAPVAAEPVFADEPIAATGPLAAAPAAEAASEPVAASGGSPADAPVTTLKGLGPKLATRLGELGITTVGQIAALGDDEAVRLDAQLGPFAGRMERDRWIEQARFLAAGDAAGFEAVFGRL
jgi:predicted flap endonuclease-1-like 5' DNA nuclease